MARWSRVQGIWTFLTGIVTIIAGFETIISEVRQIWNEEPPRSLKEGWITAYVVYGAYKICEQALFSLVGYFTYFFADALMTPAPEVSAIEDDQEEDQTEDPHSDSRPEP